jgi:hypothetical protein
MNSTLDLNTLKVETPQIEDEPVGYTPKGRYAGMKITMGIVQGISWIGCIAFASALYYSLDSPSTPFPMQAVTPLLAGLGLVICVGLAAFAEILPVIVDIEANSRKSYKLQHHQSVIRSSESVE